MRKDREKEGTGAEAGASRRDFLKTAGLGVAAAFTVGAAKKASAATVSLKGKRLAMVIDLHRCTGCGSCMVTCKNENNVQDGFAWSYKINETVGTFPNVRYDYMPTLCNHCERAPCIRICPSGAMHKDGGDITAHDPEKCIGCKSCIAACPYGVISRNSQDPHPFWKSSKELISGATDSPKDVLKKARGTAVPWYNPAREKFRKGSGVRYKGIVEKCTLCDHRLRQGKLPYCVDRCPAKARIVGDLNDPNSAVNKILAKYRPMRRKEHLGTEPKVFYVRQFNPAHYRGTKGSV